MKKFRCYCCENLVEVEDDYEPIIEYYHETQSMGVYVNPVFCKECEERVGHTNE